MAKTVAVFTSTRADYGILYWLLKDLDQDDEIKCQLLVSGSHLSNEYGATYREIEQDGFQINEKIDISVDDDSQSGMIKSMSLGLTGYSEALLRMKPDIFIILGDRFEALVAAQSAYTLKIPILHLHGGEVTEGAYDDAFRHAITKLSYFHCVACEEYKKRVIQLGESPARVFNTGALGLEHIKRSKIIDIEALSNYFNFDFSQSYILVTYHPETLSSISVIDQITELLLSLDEFDSFNIVMTYPNFDTGSQEIINLISDYERKQKERVLLVKSFGHNYYQSVIKHSQIVVGNSSSGLIEVPSLQIPTVNIGDRQKGRVHGPSVIQSEMNRESIIASIKLGLNFNDGNKKWFSNPYDDGDSSKKIIDIIKYQKINIPKSFYDIKAVS